MVKALVIGTSYGGPEALKYLLPQLEQDFPLPVIIVLHIGDHSNDAFIGLLNACCALPVKEAESKEPIRPGIIYFAPPNYHLLVEDDFTFSLSTDERINFSRPSIDVLFESAAWAYGKDLAGLLLTGANSDGAAGLKTIHDMGGLTMVQNPCTALSPAMPRAALQACKAAMRLHLEDIPNQLIQLV